MERRRIRNSQEFEQSQDLDAFLDILTNVIGILILIAVCIAIFTSSMQTVVGTPLLRSPAEGKKELTFVCEQGKIFYLPHQELAQPIIDNLIEANPNVSAETIANEVNAHKPKQLAVSFEATVWNDSIYQVYYHVDDHEKGESASQILETDSEFQKLLKTFDPSDKYVFIFVKPDSFGIVSTARKVAENLGFENGWSPLSEDENVYFSNGLGGANGVL